MEAPQEITDLIRSSGNNFHSKVARWFQGQGWHTTVSPYYFDQTQGKAREIDLIAERASDLVSQVGTFGGDLLVRLYVECKFVPQHAVFWFADKDRSEALAMLTSSGHFRQNDPQLTGQHHYLKDGARVAKLFASAGPKGQDNEPFYKALNQTLNAMVSMRQKPSQLPRLKKRGARIKLDFPVIVCSSFEHLWAADFFSDAPPIPITGNFQLEVRYAYVDPHGASRDDYFLLDVVELNQLDKFVSQVLEDASIATCIASQDSDD